MKFKKQALVPLQLDDNTTVDFMCYHVLSTSDDPTTLQQLFNGSLFNTIQPNTQELLPVHYPCAYHDANKKFIVFFNPDETIPSGELTVNLFEGLPEAVENYTLRETHYLSDFYETLNILDFGLRDTEVACVKLLTYTLLTEQQSDKAILHTFFFDRDGAPSFGIVTESTQEFTPYRQELVDIVNQRVPQLDLPKGQIHIISPQWAMQALGLN